jgi:hypothetical protein
MIGGSVLKKMKLDTRKVSDPFNLRVSYENYGTDIIVQSYFSEICLNY